MLKKLFTYMKLSNWNPKECLEKKYSLKLIITHNNNKLIECNNRMFKILALALILEKPYWMWELTNYKSNIFASG